MWPPAPIRVAMAICSAACPLDSAERARALLQRRDPLLEHRDGRIGDAAVDVAADLEVEQARGMVDVAEDERRRLVDRHRARAGRRDRDAGRHAAPACRASGTWLRPRCFPYWAVQPPSDTSCVPCMLEAVSEARNTASPAICSTVVNWSGGCFSPSRCGCACSTGCPARLARASICFCDQRRQHPAGADRVAGDAGVGAFEPTTLVKPTMPCLAAT